MSLLSSSQHETLHTWSQETGELYVNLELWRNCDNQYFLRSVDELVELISKQTSPRISVKVFRKLQYPLRGVADDNMRDAALRMFPMNYSIVSLDDYYPSALVWLGSGDKRAEFREEFSEIKGRRVGIGQNPLEWGSEKWTHWSPSEVMILNYERSGDHYKIA